MNQEALIPSAINNTVLIREIREIRVLYFLHTSLFLLAFSREATTIFIRRSLPAIALAQARWAGRSAKTSAPVRACPACPVASGNGTRVAPADATGVSACPVKFL